MPISTIDQKGLTNPLTSVAANTVASASGSALTLQTNGSTTAVTIDTSQNVGIGTSNPQAYLHIPATSGLTPQIKLGGTSSYQLQVGYNNSSEYGFLQAYAANLSTPDDIVINPSGGNLLVGTTSVLGKISLLWNSSTQQGLVFKTTSSTFNGYPIIFYNNADVASGLITQAQNSVTYGTSSDYRLKENIEPMSGALAKVSQLKPVTYKWKSDGSNGQGFIAHEIQAIVPDCVSGEKDAVNEDGSVKPQSIDTSFLVATLTAAIQELKAEFDAYKASHP
jgi:hypothetical protein